MLRALMRYLLDRLGPRYPRAVLAGLFPLSFLVVLGGVFLLDLYVELSPGQFWRVLLVTEAAVAVEIAAALWVAFRLVRPADPWLAGDRTPETAATAWRALAGLPLDLIRHWRGLPIVLNVVPVSVYLALEVGGSLFPAVVAIAAGVGVVVSYAMFLRFFATELAMRPLLERLSSEMPDGVELGRTTVPLRWRLLVGLPVMNVITGVAVVGLSTNEPSLRALGVGVLIALGVAFTISFELALLLVRSIASPLQDLQEGTERVAAGDLSARVPVVGSDETGRLAGTFNRMVAGLEERERLRQAFGAFVDPALAERVLAEGAGLEGEEVEVTVLFLDIRDFTAFAERATAQEVVAELNRFYDYVVPLLAHHGGHANKFVGDGLLGVFGAPDRLPDHADRAVDAALQIAEVVREAYGDRLRIGIGVNSGPVVAGTIGGGGRLEFTVIGDTVNTAARVEEATRETGDVVLVTEATLALLRSDHGGFVERPGVTLKGKSDRVRLFAPLAAVALAEPLAGDATARGDGVGASDGVARPVPRR
ncbi:MAG: adenylate cyclase [Solirubrobacteraceae bacterium]|jgi:class 3 adenylate cyclase|nr:adenylate cyclase [Solirubrobacteraceae bacterium]